MNKENICKTCKFWNNKQSELDYSKFSGICTCFAWEFTTTNESDVAVLDRSNRTSKHMGINRFESQKNQIPFGDVNRSNYCFVTADKFGCIHHQNKNK